MFRLHPVEIKAEKEKTLPNFFDKKVKENEDYTNDDEDEDEASTNEMQGSSIFSAEN